MSEELRSLPVAEKYYGQVAEIYDQSRQGKEEFHQDQFVIENILRHSKRDCAVRRIAP